MFLSAKGLAQGDLREVQLRGAHPRDVYLKKKRNYHDTLSYQPREYQVACQHFKQYEAKRLEETPNYITFKLPGEGIRMSAPGPHPGTSALRPQGGSMNWREQERKQQEVTRQLSKYVVEDSEDWKHEKKKANDRLYKKRDGQRMVYGKHNIRVEMLVNLKAKAEAKMAWLLQQIENKEPSYLVPPKTPKGNNMPDWHSMEKKS